MLSLFVEIHDYWMKLRGRNVHHRTLSIEDGLGMLATATNDLISYERTPPNPKINQIENNPSNSRGHSKNQIFYTGSQFNPSDFNNKMDKYSSEKQTPAVVVRPEYIRRNPSMYSETRNLSVEKSNDYYEPNNMSTPIEYYSRRRQSCHLITSNDRNNSERYSNTIKTGSNSSTPRKPASVIEWPAQNVVSTTPIHPQERSSETPTDGTNTTTSEGSPGLNNDIRYQRYSTHFADVSLHPTLNSSTTFGTNPQMKNYSSSISNIYAAEPISVMPQSDLQDNNNLRYNNLQKSESFHHQNSWDNNIGDLHSPMSSGNSSATTTTINTSTMPTIFSQNGTNKIAVAPQPQKKVSHRKEDKEHHRHHQRQSIGPSPYQMSTPAMIPTSKSANKINRLSNEVYIDGPTPTPLGDGQTDIRVSFLEDKVRDMERVLHRSSRQNIMFSPTAPTEAQQLMMQDLIDKNVLIGQLEARVRTLASQLQKQEMEFEEERRTAQQELNEAKKGHSTNKKRIQTLQEHLDEYEKLFRESMKNKEEEIEKLKNEIKKKQNELTFVEEQIKDVTKDKKETENLKSIIASKDSKIAELESVINEMKESQLMDKNYSNKNTKKYNNSNNVETLSEIEEMSNDELEFFISSPRSGAITPIASNNKTLTTPGSNSSVTEKVVTVLPNNFNNLLRTHYRKTQVCHDMATNIVEATSRILEGKATEAARLLGYYTDTEAEDSEALVSESPAVNKMSINTAEKYLRKECDMLEKVEKKLAEIRSEYFQLLKKHNNNTTKNKDCKIQ